MGLPPVSPTEVQGENATEQKPVVTQTPENVRSKINDLKKRDLDLVKLPMKSFRKKWFK